MAVALGEVDGVRSAAAPAEWRKDGTALVIAIPTADGNSRRAGRRSIVSESRRRDCPLLSRSAARRRRAPTSSRWSTATSLMIALISILTFILLARAFRSLLLPLKAVLLNLLSVAAAWV